MRINVKILNGRDCFPTVSEETSILELKQLVANELDIPVEQQRLVFQGRAMQDEMTLLQCGVKDGNKVILSVKEATSHVENKSSVRTNETMASQRFELKKELHLLLLKHFSSSDAEKVTGQFLQDLHNRLRSLSLDDIERIAQANVLNSKS